MTISAEQAFAQGGAGDAVIGWKLDRGQRRELLQQFPPHYGDVVADHVTLRGKASADAPLPGETQGEIVGRGDDGRGVEALVVAIGGTTDRPDGSTYHITWSLAPGRKAKESNDVLAGGRWQRFDLAMPVQLVPARFR
ncbi:MAG: hypothetical protein ACJ8EB_10850 [Allosphingosinicella sp.]